MGMFVAKKVVKLMIGKGLPIHGSKALVLGITFKENCPDIRNTRVVDIVSELQQFGMQVDVFDPWAEPDQVREEYGINLASEPGSGYHAVVLAVAHEQFASVRRQDLGLAANGVIYDTKAFWPRGEVDGRL
jgi:UDP-N-acetyl-D-galactosamine dehydrogenase